MRARLLSDRCNEQGQNLVELTFLLPFLLLMFLGMVDLAWWARSYLTVTTAAREGARFGSRGLHLPASDIAEVANVAMSGSLDVDLVGPDANTAIIVTEIDIDPDGSYVVHETFTLGDLAASSAVCLQSPCGSGSIDLQAMRDENVVFNGDPDQCADPLGCRNDVVVVEVFYLQKSLFGTLFTSRYIPSQIPTNARSVMRILVRRSPWG